MKKKNKIEDREIGYVKVVMIGSINPNRPFSEEDLEHQADMLNQCLSKYPKGKIIGKDISIGRFMAGEHELTMERTAYHIGFKRKPDWIE